MQNEIRVTVRLQEAVTATARVGTSTTDPEAVHSGSVAAIVKLTQAEYDALSGYSLTTLYIATQTNGSIRLFLGSMALWEDPTLVHGEGVDTITSITQSDYNALTTKDPATVYIVT